jgi:putative ABC transport system substrate-binding protein
LIGGAAAEWPLAAHGQLGERAPKIGVIMNYAEGDPEGAARFGALRDRLGALGWIEGRSAQIETRWTAGRPDLMLTFASKLVSQPVDVIVAHATPIMTILKKLTDTIPIVFTQVADPVGSGFVSNYARPEGNITGFADFDPSVASKWIEALKGLAPRLNRVTILFDPDQANHKRFLDVIESAASSFKMQVSIATAHDRTEIKKTIATAAGTGGAASTAAADGGLVVVPGPLYQNARGAIIEAAARYRVPAVYPYTYYTKDGGLLSYGTNQLDEWPHAADYVDRILKGVKPHELPVQAPTKYELAINLKTAKALGLSVPQTLLFTADEVIE